MEISGRSTALNFCCIKEKKRKFIPALFFSHKTSYFSSTILCVYLCVYITLNSKVIFASRLWENANEWRQAFEVFFILVQGIFFLRNLNQKLFPLKFKVCQFVTFHYHLMLTWTEQAWLLPEELHVYIVLKKPRFLMFESPLSIPSNNPASYRLCLSHLSYMYHEKFFKGCENCQNYAGIFAQSIDDDAMVKLATHHFLVHVFSSCIGSRH